MSFSLMLIANCEKNRNISTLFFVNKDLYYFLERTHLT